MRILLCESGLRGSTGHFFNLAAGLREELARRGIALEVWSNQALSEELRAQLDARRVFDTIPGNVHGAGPRRRQILRWLRSAWRYQRALRRADPRRGDVLLVSGARSAEILGLAGWLCTARGRTPIVWVNVMFDELTVRPRKGMKRSLIPQLYRVSFAALRRSLRGRRLVLSSPSPGLARVLEKVSGIQARVVPMLKGYPPELARDRRPPWTIGFLGTPRQGKGGDKLLRVIERCARALPECRIVAQVPPEQRVGLAEPAPSNVEWLDIGLERARYFELLHRLDVAVMPYVPHLRGHTASGVFAEAVACGCVSVVPAESWMAEMLASGRGAGVTFAGGHSKEIAAAACEAVAGLDRLLPLARAASGPWRATQSMGAFVDHLLAGLAEGDGKKDGTPRGSW